MSDQVDAEMARLWAAARLLEEHTDRQGRLVMWAAGRDDFGQVLAGLEARATVLRRCATPEARDAARAAWSFGREPLSVTPDQMHAAARRELLTPAPSATELAAWVG